MTATTLEQPAPTAVDPIMLKKAFGKFPTGVTVVTCRTTDGDRHGATINAFTAVSMDPPLAQVTLIRGNKISQFLRDGPFAINILGAGQQKTALTFAGITVAEEPTWQDAGDAPALAGNAATLQCRPWAVYDGGDHEIVLGEVTGLDVSDVEPLSFVAGKFREVGPLTDGNPWDACGDGLAASWLEATKDHVA